MKVTTFMTSKNIFQQYDVVKYGFSSPEGRMVIGKLRAFTSLPAKSVFVYSVVILKSNRDKSILDKLQIFLAKTLLFITNK